MTKITTIGLDLAKNVIQMHGVDNRGKAVVRKQLKRHAKSAQTTRAFLFASATATTPKTHSRVS